MIEQLNYIVANDKTIYGYNGSDNYLNSNGKAPKVGERFATPREIAIHLINEINGIEKGDLL